MTSKELVEKIYDFLWEVVSDKTECVNNLQEMLKDINYLEDKEDIISKTTECEILVCDDFMINSLSEEAGSIVIDCEMPYIMQTLIGEKIFWRITATTKAQIIIPGIDGYDWESVIKANTKQEMLKFKDGVKFNDIHFELVECDSI